MAKILLKPHEATNKAYPATLDVFRIVEGKAEFVDCTLHIDAVGDIFPPQSGDNTIFYVLLKKNGQIFLDVGISEKQ